MNNDKILQDKKIFLSYGHQTIDDVVIRLKDDLERLGAKVWLDSTRIQEGNQWDSEIENGIIGSDIVVALMTEHGFRRPNGVCLNEIVMATNYARHIFPIKIDSISVPLLLCRIQYLDISNDKINEEATYNRILDKIIAFSLDPKNEINDETQLISEMLNPTIEFSGAIGKLKNFIGRDWITKDVLNWLDNKEKEDNVFLLVGKPGTGKSTYSTFLATNYPQFKGIHYCKYNDISSRKVSTILKNIAFCLAHQIEEYKENLLRVLIKGDINFSDAQITFNKLIAVPIKAIDYKENVCIIIDAIDEMETNEAKELINLFESVDLPTWFKMFITTREKDDILNCFTKYKPKVLDTTNKNNLEDIEKYIEDKVGTILTNEEKQTLLEKSEGVFQYAVFACNEIIDKQCYLDLPKGLYSLYYNAFCLKLRNQEYEDYKAVFEVLSVLHEPLDRISIEQIVGEQKLRKVNEAFNDYLNTSNGYIAFTHKSFSDFLISPDNISFGININAGHKRIVEAIYENIGICEKLEDYRRQYIFYHLFEIKAYDKIVMLLNQEEDSIDSLVKTLVYSDILKQHRQFFFSLQSKTDRYSELIIKLLYYFLDINLDKKSSLYQAFSICFKMNANWISSFEQVLEEMINQNYDKAAKLGEQLVNEHKFEDKYYLAELYTQIGSGYRIPGNLKKGLEYYNKVLDVYEGDRYRLITKNFQTAFFLSDLEYVMGEVDKAIQDAEMYFELLPKDSPSLFDVCWLMTFTYMSTREYDKATKYAKQCLEIAKREKRLRLECKANYAIAETLAFINPSEALSYIEEAKRLALVLDDRVRTRIYFALVETLLAKGDYDECVKEGQEGLKGLSNWYTGVARLDMSIAEALRELGENEKAFEVAKEALYRYKNTNSYPSERIRAWTILISIALQLGEPYINEAITFDKFEDISHLDNFPNSKSEIEYIKQKLALLGK